MLGGEPSGHGWLGAVQHPLMTSNPAAQILLRIGYVFLHLQDTERVTKVAIQVAMPAQNDLFLSLVEKLDPQARKKPLGVFLVALRQRASLKADIDKLLERYLSSRNTFVHNLAEVPGWSLQTEEGLTIASAFLVRLLTDSKDVRLLFQGLLHAYKVQSEVETAPEEDAKFQALDKYEKPLFERKWIVNDA